MNDVRTAVWGLVVALMVLPASVGQAQSGWKAKRAVLREQRSQLVAEAQADAAARCDQAVSVIRGLVERIESGELTAAFEPLGQLLAGLGRLDESRLGDLRARVAGLSERQAPEALTGKAKAAWDAALAQAHTQITERPFKLMTRAADAGEVGLATELMWEVLWFNPDHTAIRKGLGLVTLPEKVRSKVQLAPTPARAAVKAKRMDYARFDPDRRWYSAFAAARLKEGLVWDATLGWVNPKFRDRYARGGVFDLQQRKWVSLQAANAYHSTPDRAWEIRTEHLLIRGTADLSVLADAATQLEAFYREIFGIYANFFAGSGRHDVLRLSLGLVQTEPLEIWILRDREQYLAVSGAPQWSGGVFIPSKGLSYFYGRVGETMFHEFTHHILREFTGRNQAPSWLTEGIAVFTQTAKFKRGRVEIPGARPSRAFSLDELMELRSGRAWHAWHNNRENPSAYADAGSLVTFGMNVQDGRCRADTIDFIGDAYLGKLRGREMWDYLGMDRQALARGYDQWRGR